MPFQSAGAATQFADRRQFGGNGHVADGGSDEGDNHAEQKQKRGEDPEMADTSRIPLRCVLPVDGTTLGGTGGRGSRCILRLPHLWNTRAPDGARFGPVVCVAGERRRRIDRRCLIVAHGLPRRGAELTWLQGLWWRGGLRYRFRPKGRCG